MPSIDKLMVDVTKTVSHPGGGTLYDDWRGDAAAPTPNRLGSGSGTAQPAVRPPRRAVHGGRDVERRRRLRLEPDDTHDNVPRSRLPRPPGRVADVGCPRRFGWRTPTRCLEVLRLRQAGGRLRGGAAESRRANPAAAQVDLTSLRQAAVSWRAASEALEAHAADLVSADSPRSGQLRRVNNALMREERLLTTRVGIPGRPWFRHQVYAPGINTGYAAQFLPGIRDALDAGDAGTVTKYRDLLLDSLHRATQVASGASGSAQAAAPKVRSTAKAAADARGRARESAAQPAP